MRSAYGAVRREPARRVVINLTAAELERIDGWAVASGMVSRTAAIRLLTTRALDRLDEEDGRKAGPDGVGPRPPAMLGIVS
jgi:hypothetical protein